MPGAVSEPIWDAEGERKRSSVRRMFAEIAPSYDRLNGIMSLSLHGRWRAEAVRLLELGPGDAALDLCCGTGDFMAPLWRAVGPKGLVVGVDFCLPMLQIAQRKSPDSSPALGDACMLPIGSGLFDAVCVGWGMRNVPDVDAAHREVARVLKPGGRFVSLDMARPGNRAVRAVSEWVFNTFTPKLGALFGSTDAYTYLPKSTQRFWSRERLAESMDAAGFESIGFKDMMLGNICMHWGTKR